MNLLRGTPELPPGKVALTFDDGPGPRTAELARLLRDEGVSATFFVLGESIERHPDAVAVITGCGHSIGLHADRHRAFRSAADAAYELGRCARRLHELAGWDGLDGAGVTGVNGRPAWFRPPYGIGDWEVPGFAGPVGWHAHGRDWDITYRKGQTVDACVDAIAEAIIERGGGIVLLHDFAAATEFVPAGLTEADLDLRIIEITTALLGRLRAAGLEFTALPEPAIPEFTGPEPTLTEQAMTPPRTAGLGSAEDMQSLRLFRRTAQQAGGILDLVMPIRVEADGPRLFCAHPMVGLSWAYLAMLPYLDEGFSLYGVQARGLRRPEPLPVSMEQMARDYADQIRRTQPSGPYFLLGWSLGGNVAFAIAEELQRRGERIALLVILDANLTDLDALEASNEPWMIYNLVLTQFGYVPGLTPADPDPEARMLELVRRRPGLGLDEWPDQRVRALQRVIRNNVAVARTHKPGQVSCPLLFFSARRNRPTLPEKLEHWRRFTDGPIESAELDCDHRYMLLPEHAARIGPVLSERLARAAETIGAAGPDTDQG